MSAYPELSFATPRRLPRANDLRGRVVVLDIAFAAEAAGTSFEKVTGRLIRDLGSRLALWVDHHDHEKHVEYATDARFYLRKKSQHGACPEMITPELVAAAGSVQTIVCHTDFDGLFSAAKWIRDGVEPYPGADADARAIDTRVGAVSARGGVLDRALRARAKDDAMRGKIVRYLVDGCVDSALTLEFAAIADTVRAQEEESERLAQHFHIEDGVAVCDASRAKVPFDKTILLLLGQQRARVSVVLDQTTITAAAAFDSGIDLLSLLKIEGGMPTRVSLPVGRADATLKTLKNQKF